MSFAEQLSKTTPDLMLVVLAITVVVIFAVHRLCPPVAVENKRVEERLAKIEKQLAKNKLANEAANSTPAR
ncbi:hypothetical protein PTTG_12305 [Puccinia triticina 1-1 BBBD Race 1]|uniref:Uncharacterized protein n=2 Tax=Puccinia triticina TaxID=208348 RepID=A0A180H235_PUCT1|nr:uncharacterized protein PtA15_9A455 [Puccinia triticina]OAV98423.1 hypothetical protein PTTG_12305 [Puccinia triticina 1-1 BBBD Race 1]WAQ88328.1 hypothetical protein PtA15_9A455 [Puccinia triticina]WAR60508.1 hypothetical protein PtB15_9B447 [Puccinia triticina]